MANPRKMLSIVYHDEDKTEGERVLTMERAAVYLSVSTGTVYNLIRSGKLRPIPLRVGKAALIPESQVTAMAAFLRARDNPPKADPV